MKTLEEIESCGRPMLQVADVAEFIGCDTDEVALVQNTTHGLGIIANAIPLEKGDNILVCDLEYQASTVCWKPPSTPILAICILSGMKGIP